MVYLSYKEIFFSIIIFVIILIFQIILEGFVYIILCVPFVFSFPLQASLKDKAWELKVYVDRI